MSAKTVVLVAALLVAACSSASSPSKTPAPPQGGSGGAGTAGTGGGQPGAGEGGSGGAAVPADAAPGAEKDAAAPTPDASTAPGPSDGGPSAAGGTALMVVGKGPLIGDDLQIQKVLQDKGLKVETVADGVATAGDATGKRVVILSYSLDSDLFKNKADYAAVPVPLIVMEHALLGTLDMATNHKWAEPATQITISYDGPLAAGFPQGDLTVYGKSGEVFWGVPSASAIKVATVKGNANQWTIFAYAAGAMMMTKPAPGKRMQFFMGAHQVPTQYMNAAGLKLLDAAIDWSIK
jgi:hypothetical protein